MEPIREAPAEIRERIENRPSGRVDDKPDGWRKLRVNLVTWGARRTGGQYLYYKCGDWLTRRGHKVTIVTLDDGHLVETEAGYKPDWYQELLADIVRVDCTPSYRAASIMREQLLADSPDSHLRYVLEPLRQLNACDGIPECDVNVATYHPSALSVFRSGKGCGFYHLQHFERLFFGTDTLDLEGISKNLVEESYFYPLNKTANSSWLRDRMLEEYGLSLPVVFPGILESFYPREVKKPGRGKWVVALGKQLFWKGIVELMEAMPLVQEKVPDAELVLFGVEPGIPRKYPYKHVHSPSFDELAALYSMADVVVCPSWYESWPAPPAEAMSCGTPVVTTRLGTEDYCYDGVTALVVEPRDPRALAGAIVRVLTERDLAEHLVANGLEIVKNFTWDTTAAHYESLYLDAVGAGERGERQVIKTAARSADAAAGSSHAKRSLRFNYTVTSLGKTGGCITILELANRLVAMGHDVSITTANADIGFFGLDPSVRLVIPEVDRETVARYEASVRAGDRHTATWLPVELLAAATPACDANIATDYKSAYAVMLSGAGTGFYHMQHYEEVFSDEEYQKRLAVGTYKLPLFKIANSLWLAGVIERLYGVRPPVMNPGLDHRKFYPRPPVEHDGEAWVVSLGRPQDWKGFGDASEAMKIVQAARPDVRWKVYGSFDMPSLKGAARHDFLKNISDDELATLYSSADVVISPSWYESFPGPPIEAMACGAPVVTTSIGVEDYARDGVNSLVVPPRDPEALAAAILRVLGDGELRERMVASALATAGEYTWEKTAERLVEIVRRRLDESETAPCFEELLLSKSIRPAGGLEEDPGFSLYVYGALEGIPRKTWLESLGKMTCERVLLDGAVADLAADVCRALPAAEVSCADEDVGRELMRLAEAGELDEHGHTLFMAADTVPHEGADARLLDLSRRCGGATMCVSNNGPQGYSIRREYGGLGEPLARFARGVFEDNHAKAMLAPYFSNIFTVVPNSLIHGAVTSEGASFAGDPFGAVARAASRAGVPLAVALDTYVHHQRITEGELAANHDAAAAADLTSEVLRRAALAGDDEECLGTLQLIETCGPQLENVPGMRAALGKLVEAGHIRAASWLANLMEKTAPDDTDVLIDRACLLYMMEEYALCEKKLKAALAIDEDHVPALMNLANLYLNSGLLDDAGALCRKVLQLSGEEREERREAERALEQISAATAGG